MESLEYTFENEEQFWAELEEIVSTQSTSHLIIDNSFRIYLQLVTKFADEYFTTSEDWEECAWKLLNSKLFQVESNHVRYQIIQSIIQTEDLTSIYLLVSVLLLDGLRNEETFEMMKHAKCFPRLIDLIRLKQSIKPSLLDLLLKLLYEMSRCQQLSIDDLKIVDESFVISLLDMIEELSQDINDPYHYPVIRVLVRNLPSRQLSSYLNLLQLVLNEQFMISSTTSLSAPNAPSLTNRVVKLISSHGSKYMTFGENLIILLNRETEISLQLLILKLFYLLFTTPATYEYFYTNDLRVLVDVIIRNLLDLPRDLSTLRHTYLRVLYPLLAYSQLKCPPHYKTKEITRVIDTLGNPGNAHWEPTDTTTLRLVNRIADISWLQQDRDSIKSPRIRLTSKLSASDTSVEDIVPGTEKDGDHISSRYLRSEASSSCLSQVSDIPTESGNTFDNADASHPLPLIPPTQNNLLPVLPGKKARPLPPKIPPPRRTKPTSTLTPEVHSTLI
ncbi:Protein LDB17 [Blumeria hordei DH14]|uniref:Protein LDB17 n=1 Tax=Blumeria graminis f. sp. hordei (strain DH14) TaxID=546991 RepID=N1J5Y4_BLUG1|nr:Protein LDB17 [Blumeria hordei DH14]